MNTEGLFSALRKYRVRDTSDPLENFVTEAFAWLLKRDSGFSTFFLNSLASRHSNNTDDFKNTNWFTQCNWDGKFPDMVCEVEDQISGGTFAYVFEHKVWSHLHEKQLDNYKDYASEKYNDRYKLIWLFVNSCEGSGMDVEKWHDISRRTLRAIIGFERCLEGIRSNAGSSS